MSAENKSKHDIIDKLQDCANSLDSWCISNKMVLSIEKNVFLSQIVNQIHNKRTTTILKM